MEGMYGLFLALAAAAGCAALCLAARREGLARRTGAVLVPLATVLGALGARMYHYAANSLVYGLGFEGFELLSPYPYEYAMCGALLGVLLAGWLTAGVTKQSTLRVLDALAPAGLLALALARFGEHFSDFGWGQVLSGERWQFFPVAVQDMYGQWHLAVYMLEGALALIVCAYALRAGVKRPGSRFFTALAWWAATQVFCESLRAETIRWGFVRVQQLQCVVFLLGVLAVYTRIKRSAGKAKETAASWLLLVLGVGVVVLMEFAIDKWDLAITACYAIMAAALAVMGLAVQAQRPKE